MGDRNGFKPQSRLYFHFSTSSASCTCSATPLLSTMTHTHTHPHTHTHTHTLIHANLSQAFFQLIAIKVIDVCKNDKYESREQKLRV